MPLLEWRLLGNAEPRKVKIALRVKTEQESRAWGACNQELGRGSKKGQ